MTEKTAKPFRVVVFADFVCPYSYLAVEQIDRLAREYEVQPLWRPYWLHPDTPLKGKPRDTADDDAKRERLHAWVKEMAPEQYPRIRFPQKRQYSFSAFEALEFAYDHGLDLSFKTSLYEMMWTQERDIGEPETLLAAAALAGLDPDELAIALDEHRYAERVRDSIQQARDIGITNTPTIFLGKTRINGWTYYEVMQSVMEKQGMQRSAALAN
ncbi:MAG: DsbA family protein [Pseudomonadota bacterium]